MGRSRIVPWNGKLFKALNALLVEMLRKPLLGVLLPFILVTLVAYPSIYSTQWIFSLNGPHNAIRSVTIDPVEVHESVDIVMRSFDFRSVAINVTSNRNDYYFDQLTHMASIESRLLKDINASVIVYSPLEYWNHNTALLSKDGSILKTINSKAFNKLGNQRLTDLMLFPNITFNNGIISEINSFKLIVLYPPDDDIDATFSKNLHLINKSLQDDPTANIYSLKTNKWDCLDCFAVNVLPFIVLLCIFVYVSKVQTSNSKYGLMLAIVTQIVLSAFASCSFTIFAVKSVSLFHQIPISLLIAVPGLMTTIIAHHLINNFTKSSEDIGLSLKLRKAVIATLPLALDWTSSLVLIFFIVSLLTESRLSLQFCIFSISSILINFILNFTAFPIILALDSKRYEMKLSFEKKAKKTEDDDHTRNNSNKNYTSHSKQANASTDEQLLPLLLKSKTACFLKTIVKKLLGRYNLPYLNTFMPVLASAAIFFLVIIRWTSGDKATNSEQLNVFLNKRGFVSDIGDLLSSKQQIEDGFNLKAYDPIDLLNNNNLKISMNEIFVKYQFDYLCCLELISLLLFLICTGIAIFKLLFVKSKKKFNYNLFSNEEFSLIASTPDLVVLNADNELVIKAPPFNYKELINGHMLDIVKVCTSACPFIVSVGMDHKVLVWSPMNNPIPLPTQLPLSEKLLPVTHAAMSDTGSLIAVFSKSGLVKCWSRLSMSWIWSIQIDELNNSLPLTTFFRKKMKLASNRRKLVSRLGNKKDVKKHSNENLNDTIEPKRSTFKERKASVSSTSEKHEENIKKVRTRKREKSTISNSCTKPNTIDSDFNCSSNMKLLDLNSKKEFIIVSQEGDIIAVDCQTGNIERSTLSDSSILCAEKLSSPRVNDRIVGIKKDGDLVVATSVNNKWISRTVSVDKLSYNMGRSLVTPALISNYQHISEQVSNSDISDKRVEFKDKEENYDGVIMETVPFICMIVRAFRSKAQLIDVQTGTLLKEWEIKPFERNTFKVFHPEPSHCRFCGCASVGTFSVAYTELNTNVLTMHTFSIDNRAKNSICLRVERDSRETRCLGFASTNEHRHLLTDVAGWCATDFNKLIGVRRKNGLKNNQRSLNEMKASSNSSFRDQNNGILRNRSADKANESKNDEYENVTYGKLKNRVNPTLDEIWEGWTMASDGQVKCYEIPNGSDSRILIKNLGPIQKFGHKSIIVSFGNIMKIFYLGNEGLIEEGEPDDELSGGSMSQTSSSLSFINRRRKLRLKKYDLTHSTKFEDVIKEVDDGKHDDDGQQK